jgi:hypothetical protein
MARSSLRIRQALLAIAASCAIPAFVVADPPAVDGDRAFGYLEQVCDIGPRISGTTGMETQQNLIEEHFTELGYDVHFQAFDARHPETGEPVRLKNMIVQWRPDAAERILLCCHYDTRPRPDREFLPANRDRPFIGANDGGSGVALFMEMAHHMNSIECSLGVDFVFFDAEELVYVEGRDDYFLGSKHFATEYRDNPPEYRYVKGVLLDMIGDRDFRVYYERNSLRYAEEVTHSIWDTAERMGVREFVPRRRYEIRDDHLPLNQIAGIPTCDVIDFDYENWHKRNDLPEACSGDTLELVARVMLQWLSEQ